MEEEKDSVDGEFQEPKFIDEKFQHEDIEDLSQRFEDWDSLPTYDDDINEEDPIEEPLVSDLEEEYKEYGLRPMFGGFYLEEEDQLKKGEHGENGFFPMFSGFYLDEDDQLEDEKPIDDITNYKEDDIADYEEVNEDISGEMPNFNGEDVDYVNFLGSEDILNSPHDEYGEFYADDENYMFTRETITKPFLNIFMAHGREKER
jgi:hypothetical protein